MRLVLIFSLVFFAAACTAPAGESLGTVPEATSSPARATEIVVKDFALVPGNLAVSAGRINLEVTNEGPTVHNVAIRTDAGDVLATTRDLRTGESQTISPEIPAGTYVLFCSLPGHESLGIKGTLDATQ